jgi:hypothetical protein
VCDPLPTPLEVAEAPFIWQPPEPGISLTHGDPRFVLQHDPFFDHPYFGTVTRIRVGTDVAAAVAAARKWFSSVGRQRFSWWVRQSANPPHLVEELLQLGLEVSPHDGDGLALMSLEDEPPLVPGVVVRKVDSYQDDLAAAALFAEVFCLSEVDRLRLGTRIESRWADRPPDRQLGLLAYIDGRLAARGNMIMVGDVGYIYSAATVAGARGRGCYRALVRARWEAMRAMNGTSLVVQAGQDSQPILAGLGFRVLDRLDLLLDHS